MSSLSRDADEAEVIRIFKSAVHPDEVEEVVRLFAEDVKPVFESIEGCLSIELVAETSQASTGLVEGAVITRWKSRSAMLAGLEDPRVEESQQRVRRLLRRQPIVIEYTVLA
jgi:quinol monooxygenase YgiN